MTHELALKLKEAGFPQIHSPIVWMPWFRIHNHGSWCENGKTCNGSGFDIPSVTYPTLSELIEACGDAEFFDISKLSDGWIATDHYRQGSGTTPEEAVANLWLVLNVKG